MSDYNQSFKSIGIDFFLHITLVHKAFDYNFFYKNYTFFEPRDH